MTLNERRILHEHNRRQRSIDDSLLIFTWAALGIAACVLFAVSYKLGAWLVGMLA